MNYQDFDPKEFEGKNIDEYQFPQEVIERMETERGNFSQSDELIICFPKKRGCYTVSQIFFFVPFVVVGIGVILFGLNSLITYVSGDGGNIKNVIFLLVFGVVWSLITFFGVYGRIKHVLFTYWFKITPNGFDCYYGRKFNPQKAVKFTLSDEPKYTEVACQTNDRRNYYDPDMKRYNLNISGRSNEYKVQNVAYYQIRYLKKFLEYHIKHQKQENPAEAKWNLV